MKLRILHEDDFILALYKPSGVVTMGARGEESLYADALKHVKNQTQLYCAHRLDKETEGIVVMAKGHHAKAALEELFFKRRVFKEYIAVVPPQVESLFTPTLWREQDKKFLKVLSEGKSKWLEITLPIYGVKTKSHVSFDKGQPSYTKFTIDKTSDDLSIIRVQLKSGRFHQIRCHLSYLGFPLIGDKVYGSKIAGEISLVAHELSFTFPLNKRQYRFKI